METGTGNPLFTGLHFYLCLSSGAKQCDQVKSLITLNGGNVVNYLIDLVTHVVADSPDHPDVQEAIDIFEKIVVKPEWIEQSLASQSFLPVDQFSPVQPKLFSTVTACPSSLSLEDTETIWAIVTYFGGSFQTSLDANVTHLVAASPSGRKYTEALKHPNKIKLVTPDWITDSLKNKFLSDERPYHPSLLMPPSTASAPIAQKHLFNQVPFMPLNQSGHTKLPPNKEGYFTFDTSIKLPYDLCVFSCVFYFTGFDEKTRHDNLNFTCEQLKNLETNIINHGGSLIPIYDPDKVTHVIVDTQAHPIVPRARADGKRIVNIYWLEDVILNGKLHLPEKALHFPRSALISFLPQERLNQLSNPSNLVTFRSEKIAVSGFTPAQISSLSEMIKQIGATLTHGLQSSNTLLISNTTKTEKYQKAIQWSIPVVSAHWLLDVFLGINDAHKQPFGTKHPRHKQIESADPFQLDLTSMRHLFAGWNVPIKLNTNLLAAKVSSQSVLGVITNTSAQKQTK